jgi:integrase
MSRCNTVSTSALVAHDCSSWHSDDQARWTELFDPDQAWFDPIWVRQTQYQNAGVYTRYLNAVRAAGAATPRFVTPRGLQAFIRATEAKGCRVRTIAGYTWALYKMTTLLWPNRSKGWLRQSCQELEREAVRTSKRKITRIPDPGELLILADDLLQAARTRPVRDWRATELFRTGLYIRLGLYMPERLRALCKLQIDWVDFEVGQINLPGAVIKTKDDRARHLPPHALHLIKEWLSDWRASWIASRKSAADATAASHDSLWIGKGGKPASDGALTASLGKMTKSYFGYPVTSHRFRDAAATLHVERAPAEAQLARQNLGQRSDAMIREYTETAKQVAAGKSLAAALDVTETELRKRVRASSRTAIALNPRSRRRRRGA